MHHCCIMSASISNTANTALTAVADQIASTDGGQFFFPEDVKLVAAWVGSATLDRARLSSPELRQIFIPYLVPATQSLLVPDNPNIVDLRDNPYYLRGLERFQVEATSTIAMGNETCTAALFVMSQYNPAPTGGSFWIRATGTTTVTAGAWSDVTLTFDQQIARGRYAIIGGEAKGATIIAWRLILDSQFYRPGGLGKLNNGRRSADLFRNGGLGNWGEFLSTSLPRLQLYCTGADTSQDLWLQVVRVGA